LAKPLEVTVGKIVPYMLLFMLVNEMGEEAQRNDLTPEILNDILNG